jgi:hypothetical protein
MAEEREYVLERPNRQKASSKTSKGVVILLLLVSVLLMLIVTVGGWGKLQGAQAVQIAYIVVYLVMAFYVARWNRGVLPLAAALAILLGVFAAVAGPRWFARDDPGFATPDALWGGDGLDAGLLGLFTLLIVPVQVLIVVFSLQAFRQEWHVEVEVPVDEATRSSGPGGTRPATA